MKQYREPFECTLSTWVVLISAALALTAFAGWGKDKQAAAVEQDRQEVTWSTRIVTVTNKVEKGEYEKRTNGYMWVENAETFPRTIPHAEVKDWVGTIGQWNSICTITNMIISSIYYNGANLTMANAPDPFEEKITVTMFVVLEVKEYVIHVGPLDSKYCTQYTVLDRWRTVRKQRISQTDTTEIKKD